MIYILKVSARIMRMIASRLTEASTSQAAAKALIPAAPSITLTAATLPAENQQELMLPARGQQQPHWSGLDSPADELAPVQRAHSRFSSISSDTNED